MKVLKGTYLFSNDYVKQDKQFHNVKLPEEKAHCLSHQSFFISIITPTTEKNFTIRFVLPITSLLFMFFILI